MSIELAYELADQYTAKTAGYTRISIERYNFNHVYDNKPTIEYILSGDRLPHNTFDSVDALVARLKELTQPEPELIHGWFVNGDMDISDHQFTLEQYKECTEGGLKIYPTKAQLIESQIEYWQELRNEQILSGEWKTSFNEAYKKASEDALNYGIGFMRSNFEDSEYCNVSGAKLGNREECEHELMSKYGDCGECGLQIECKHETDWNQFKKEDDGYKFKCIKCGEFYR